MTLMTTMRGLVKTREWMRTQDPRLAPSTELAAKDDGRIAFFPPRMLSGKAPLFPERGRGDGALRRNPESRGPQQPVEADKRQPLSPYYNDVLDAVQPWVEAKKMLSSLLRLPPAPSRGYTPYYDQSQTGMLDYTGKKYDNLPPGLPANLSKIMFVKNLLANTRSVLRGGANVALCVRAQLAAQQQHFIHEVSCALESAAAAPQFAYSQLKTLPVIKYPLGLLTISADTTAVWIKNNIDMNSNIVVEQLEC